MKPVDVNADTVQQDALKAPDAESTDLTGKKVPIAKTTKVKASSGGGKSVLVVLVVVLVLAATAAGLYYGGVIKI